MPGIPERKVLVLDEEKEQIVRKKKMFAAGLALALILSMMACGSKSGSTEYSKDSDALTIKGCNCNCSRLYQCLVTAKLI